MMKVFDFQQDLPAPGTTTVIEASAGTGKTFAIAGLVARFVAEGVELPEILAVTFSRRATAELREGIRHRLVRSRELLTAGRAGTAENLDVVDAVLAQGSAAELATRHDRFVAALRQIDTAPIVTLHTFASRMLDELGLLADHDANAELTTDVQVLQDEVSADVFVGAQWPFSWEFAKKLADKALNHRFEPLHPRDDPGAEPQVQFASRVRELFAERKRLRRALDYDDLIGRLADTLASNNPDARVAAETLSSRFRVVLVDEFQDTDPQQWAFLSAGFHRRSTMVLIGDPKQAIYRFRGGDIETYAQARASADSVLTLGTNFRSDEPVVRGIENIFGPIDLGTISAPIELHKVEVHHQQPRIRRNDAPLPEAVRVRALNTPAAMRGNAALARVRQDVVAQVAELLNGSYSILDRNRGHWRAVDAGDIAILVTANWFGKQTHQALRRAGYSSVFSGDDSIFATPAANDWLTVLEALEAPSSYQTRRAMLTSLVGWDVARFASAEVEQVIEQTALLSRCGRLLTDQGVAAVFEALVTETDLYARLLANDGGETLVTDLRHIAEILNEAQRTARLSAAALTEFLRRRINQASPEGDDRARRLPTDRKAIKVLTVHQAKGLQFPIVLLPQAFDAGSYPDKGEPLLGQVNGVRVLDVTHPMARIERADGYRAEELAESLRKFYVAATRAESLLICWWAPAKELTDSSPLHRLLRNDPFQSRPDPDYPIGRAAMLAVRPRVELVDIDPDQISQPAAVRPAAPTDLPLSVRQFRDHIDRAWTRTSYTGLTAAVHGQPVPATDQTQSDETELAADLDRTAAAPTAESVGDLTAAPSSALAELPGGTQFGSLVHAILERVDPASAQLRADLGTQVDLLLQRFPLSGIDREALVTGLEQTLSTRLGVLTDDRSLRELGAANQLAELDFEVPLGAAERHARVGDLAQLFSELPADDPLQPYGHALKTSTASWAALRGFLTGSIDVVLQVPGKPTRYVVLDYKTNRVPTPLDEPLTALHYSPAAMTTAMAEAHYPLQALLYCVALHRYLGWRLPGYDPHAHLGGVGYLFVRGMVGPDNPQLESMPAGVFTWQPPAELVIRASELLAGGQR